MHMSVVKFLAAACSLILFSTHARTEIVYDNTPNWTLSNGILSGAEWADDVHLTKGGQMSEFSFGFVSNGSTQATIRLYTNNAANSPIPTAGTHFYSKTVAIPGGGSSGTQTVVLPTPVAVPPHLWMSIQFNGGSGAVPLNSPPVVGSSSSNMVVHMPSGTSGNVFGSGKNSFGFAIRLADCDWTNLGHALPGVFGPPNLLAYGTLAAGTVYSFQLSNASPHSSAWMILGASTINAPLFGGVLVPAPDVVIPIVLDGAGKYSITDNAPAGIPSGVTIAVQFWIQDGVAVQQYSASNARATITP
jgi:hypothetical protein